MKHFIDARGLACPLPVVNTKNEIKTMNQGESVEVLVDNEIAVQNLTKFANVRHHTIHAKKLDDQCYQVIITVGENKENVHEDIICEPTRINNQVVVLSSQFMGNGDETLGKTLMKAFIFALTKQDVYPKTILLYNGGAFLSCHGSDSLEDLKSLEAAGVEILTCGTCLNYYGITDKLEVGGVTNMYDIVEKMNQASLIIKP